MTRARQSHLILGGARSGKSHHAVALASSFRCRTAFVATAPANDPAMRDRIDRHRRERPSEWMTIEAPVDVTAALRELARHAELIVVDCLTLWVSNQMARGSDDATIIARGEELARVIADGTASWIAVSNEVGEGVHPSTALGVRFRDLLGAINQVVAESADHVTLMVAGIPVAIKRPAGAGGTETISHARVPEAP